MFWYVEYLRAVRALRIVAILLGLLLVAALVARLSWGKLGGADDFASTLEHSRTAHVTRTTLPNGDTRTVIDDPKQGLHTVVERQRGRVTRVTSIEAGVAARGTEHHRERPRNARASPAARVVTPVTAWTYALFDIGVLFSFTVPMGLLAATLLAGPLSKENNGHLELAWTKPVSRESYALSAVLVDIAALVVAQVAMLVAMLAAASFWDVPRVSFDASAPARVAFSLAAPIAWYACLTAFSASLRRGPGAVLGIGWVVAVVCPAIAAATHDASTPVGRSVYAVFNTVSYLDPIAYAWFQMDAVAADPARATIVGLLALAALAVAYIAAALLQWRRVEA